MTDINTLLQHYRAEAPVAVDALIQNLGIKLEAEAHLEPGISGHIKRETDGSYVIRTNGQEHLFRRRFTMAHELGHYILHRSILDSAGGVNDSTMYRTDAKATGFNLGISDVHERQANSFASNLLMPNELVTDFWTGLSSQAHGETPSLREMFRHFHVSPSAMRWKLRNLNLDYVP